MQNWCCHRCIPLQCQVGKVGLVNTEHLCKQTLATVENVSCSQEGHVRICQVHVTYMTYVLVFKDEFRASRPKLMGEVHNWRSCRCALCLSCQRLLVYNERPGDEFNHLRRAPGRGRVEVARGSRSSHIFLSRVQGREEPGRQPLHPRPVKRRRNRLQELPPPELRSRQRTKRRRVPPTTRPVVVAESSPELWVTSDFALTP